MTFTGIGKVTHGRDFNFFQKINVTAVNFGDASPDGSPDMIISFPIEGMIMINEASSGSTTSVVEFSFNGLTVHGELDSSLPSRTLTFYHRMQNLVWFRVKSGSSGPVTISVNAWATP